MKILNEEELIENRKIREKMMNEANLSIFNKFKEIVFLDDNEVVTINQVAEYYEVTNRTIENIITEHKDELINDDGVKVLRGDNLKEFKGSEDDFGNLENKIKYSSQLTVFPRRAVLRVGMLLRDSEVAKKIRNYLLNVEEVVDSKDREWAILREAGIIVRKDFMADVAKSNEPVRFGNSAYGYYTNMVYRILFGKKAAKLKKEMDVDNIRDNISKENLEELRRTERSIGGLLLADFKGEKIYEMLS
jgi:hypothetical protein